MQWGLLLGLLRFWPGQRQRGSVREQLPRGRFWVNKYALQEVGRAGADGAA